MSATVFGRARLLFSVMAVTAFSALVLVGCGDKSTDSIGGGLILPDGEAWIATELDGDGDMYGYALRNDGTILELYFSTSDITWYSDVAGTYTLSGNSITVNYYGYTTTGTYSVSGTGIGATVSVTFPDAPTINAVRTSVNTTTNPPPATGGNLVLGANEAWVATVDGDRVGLIFKANHDLVSIFYLDEIGWLGNVNGTWSTSGSNITIIFNDPDEGPSTGTGTYSVSGNNATITIDGETVTFTKTGNITYIDMSGLLKSRADKKLPRIFSKNTR